MIYLSTFSLERRQNVSFNCLYWARRRKRRKIIVNLVTLFTKLSGLSSVPFLRWLALSCNMIPLHTTIPKRKAMVLKSYRKNSTRNRKSSQLTNNPRELTFVNKTELVKTSNFPLSATVVKSWRLFITLNFTTEIYQKQPDSVTNASLILFLMQINNQIFWLSTC